MILPLLPPNPFPMSSLTAHDPLTEPTIGEAAADPFYGLRTNPPGQWGHVKSPDGKTNYLIIKGGMEFHRRAMNLIYSYFRRGTDGPDDDSRPVVVKDRAGDTTILEISRRDLVHCVNLWFYGQVYKAKALLAPVLDDEGEVLDYVTSNEEELTQEAREVAESFVVLISGQHLGWQFQLDSEAQVA